MRYVHKSISVLLATLLCVFMMIPQSGFAASKPTFSVDSISAKAGSSVTVDVSVKDNPGILGLTLKVQYDEGLTLVSGQSGDAFSALTLTRPGQFVSGCNFVWDAQELSPDNIKNGTVLRMVFEVANDAEAGTDLGIRISCDGTDVDLNTIDANVVNGKVSVVSDTAETAELESISADLAQDEYDVGDELSLDDLEVIAVYSDGTTKILSESEYTVDSSAVDMSVACTHYLTVSYTENGITKTTTVPVKVNAILTGITLKPSKTVYKAGDTLDLSGLTVMASYSDNQTKKVTNYQTNAADIDMQTVGEKTVEVTYSEKAVTVNASYKIEVTPVLTSIAATKSKTDYKVGDTLNVDDLTVTASYLGQDSKQVSGFTTNADEVDMTTSGEKTLTVSYSEDGVTKTADVTINVGKALKSIYLEKDNTTYYLNETVDLSDLKVYAKYTEGPDEEVAGYTTNFDDLDFDSVGTKTLTVQYLGKTAEIDINVIAGISYIEAEKTKTAYVVGDTLNIDDLTVTAYFQDGSKSKVSDFTTNADEVDMSTPGIKDLSVSYVYDETEVSTTVQIVVIEQSHAEDQPKADAVSNAISKIDLNNWETVAAARAAYDALNDDQKALVTNLSVLEAAEQKIATETTDISTLEFEPIEKSPYDGYAYCVFGYWARLKTGEILNANTDYVVEYRNHVNAGTATVTLRGRGKYRGIKEINYTITPLDMGPYKSDFYLSTTSYVYNGKVRTPGLVLDEECESFIAPEPTKKDYTVKYSTNHKTVGKHTVTYTFKGNYKGSFSYSFKIVPKGTSLSKLTAAKKGFTVSWTKQKVQTSGYEIQYALNSKFTKSKKTVTVKKPTTTKTSIKKLKAKKKYYVRIRTYKTVSGKKYCSSWSKYMTIKTK